MDGGDQPIFPNYFLGQSGNVVLDQSDDHQHQLLANLLHQQQQQQQQIFDSFNDGAGGSNINSNNRNVNVNMIDMNMMNSSSSNSKGMRIGNKRKKSVPARVAFHTRCEEDILDDGYKWRKYGQKSVKNSAHPRSYYRCTHHTCNVKKQIQRLSKDTSIVVTTYEGIHNHPCEKLMETLSPLLKQLQFLSRF
ncbi:probable WRKY transcription factor 43 [Andrographis paniculata]|uniref:probable WRKY transcription factor 43 n=1 Tax=Andrographis paniculata TaxID=175694 RepID=UPI0021E74198|nr:probable WRKY transcription factor 43 [Andrographis paniculata]